MIDDITIDLWSYWNFASIEDIRKKCKLCNRKVNFSKFTSNKYIYIYILSGVVNLVYN